MAEELEYNAYEEWFAQADYDFGTAEAMYTANRMVYVVFLCHLTVEKSLKAIWVKQHQTFPPKTHNLLLLVERLSLSLDNEEQINFISSLNTLSVPTRYPESLKTLTLNFILKK